MPKIYLTIFDRRGNIIERHLSINYTIMCRKGRDAEERGFCYTLEELEDGTWTVLKDTRKPQTAFSIENDPDLIPFD